MGNSAIFLFCRGKACLAQRLMEKILCNVHNAIRIAIQIASFVSGANLSQPHPASLQLSADQLLQNLISYMPRGLIDQIQSTRGQLVGERRFVTILFADLSGFTSLSEKLDPEAVTEIVNRLFEKFVEVIYRYEGTIDKFIGDAIMVFFGAPIAHENDPERAIRTSLEMMQAFDELKEGMNLSLSMKIGVNSGTVVIGNVGSDLRMEYTAMGDAVNLTQRLQDTAERGQIVVSRSVYNATRMFFDFKSLKAIKVKGKEGKVERYLAIGIKEVFQELKGLGYGQLVGRDREMEIIQNMVGAVREPPLHLSDKGGLLEIKGEAGIGKSRLKYELRQLIKDKDISFYQGYCPAYEVPIPYYPFSLILKEVLKLADEGNEETQKKALADAVKGLGEDLIDTVPYLGAVLSLVYEEVAALDDVSRQERIFSAIKSVFERLSRQKPLVLVFEDVQWIDVLSKSLLTYLIEHSEGLPILFCCLYRPEFEPTWTREDRVQIELRTITKEDEVRLIGSLLEGLSLPQNLVELILSKSEGNPFYLEEMIRSLMDQGILVKGRRGFELKGEIGNIDIPDTIQGVIMSRLDRLEKRSKEALQYASVIGREFPQRILEEISERGREVEEHLSLLQRLELIFQKQLLPELEYIFKHFLTQEVAYNSILMKKRRELHLKIAKAIEKLYRERLEKYYELLGYHYERAESWIKATEYFGKAGKKAEKLHSEEITTEHREREEAAFTQLIFRFLLHAIGSGILLGIMSVNFSIIFMLSYGRSVLTLNQLEYYELLSLKHFGSLLSFTSTVLLLIGLFLTTKYRHKQLDPIEAFIKIFCPSWALTRLSPKIEKFDWHHPVIIFKTRFRKVFDIDKTNIIFLPMSFILLLPIIFLSGIGIFLIPIKFLKPFLPEQNGIAFLGYFDFLLDLNLITIVAGTLVCMVFGALLWLAYSKAGILKIPAKIQIPPLDQALWIGLHGAFAGGLIYNVIKLGLWAVVEFGRFFMDRFDLMINIEIITKLVVGITLIYCWVGLVIGTVLFASARPDISLKKRLKASSFGWIIGLGGVIIGLMFYYLVMVGKYDYGRDPAQAIGIPKAASSNKTIVIFKGNKRPVIVRKPLLYSEMNYTLDDTEESIQKTMVYLHQRNYTETSLLSICWRHILESQRLNWDFDSAIEWLYKVAKSGSSLASIAIRHFSNYISKFATKTKSPKWLKLLDDIAKDEKRFYFSPEACERMGNAYWSFARREDAIYWYKKADLSQQRLEEIERKPLPFIRGSIEGKILINDKTVPGIKVGVTSRGGEVRASTETDLKGTFRLEHLIEDEYRFALMADEKLIPADAKKVKVINAPDKITINAQNPAVDLGEIKIVVAK